MGEQLNILRMKFAKQRDVIRRREGERSRPYLDQKIDEFACLQGLLKGAGKFYQTSGGIFMFFRHDDSKLLDIGEPAFEDYLVEITEDPGSVARYFLPRFRAHIRVHAPKVDTHFVGYSSPDLRTIALNSFNGRMMYRRAKKSWEEAPNGTNNILFRTSLEFLTPWKPDFDHGGAGKDLDWLCSFGHFDDSGPLTVEDQRHLLRVWLLHLFLPEIVPDRPIPVFQGPTGSGKTIFSQCIGRWLTGPQFEVTGLAAGGAQKAEEALKIALYKRPLVVLDNIDSPTNWMKDVMCRVSTGERVSVRKLYTDADEVFFTPRGGLIITSIDPYFRRGDVARRVLPISFRELPDVERLEETKIRKEIAARSGRIWADVLSELGQIQDAWPKLQKKLKPSHSLTDFSRLGAVVTIVRGGSLSDWQAIMGRLQEAQSAFAVEGNELIPLLRELNNFTGSTSELLVKLQDKSQITYHPFSLRDAGSLTKKLKQDRAALEKALGVQILFSNSHRGGIHHLTISRVG